MLVVSLMAGCLVGCSAESSTVSSDNKQNTKPVIEETRVDFIKDGTSEYCIVHPANATENELFAATELQYFIQGATGAKLSIVEETADLDAGKYIYVGATLAADAAKVQPTYDELKYNGFVIKQIDDDVYLRGYSDVGTRNAVYEFLYYAFDYEFYAADEIRLTETKNAKMLAYDLSVVPTFDWREGNYGEIIYNPTISHRMRFNETEEIFVTGHLTHNSMTIIDPTESENRVLKAGTFTSDEILYVQSGLTPGETYTISFDIKGSTNISFNLFSGDTGLLNAKVVKDWQTATTSWSTKTYTYTVPSGNAGHLVFQNVGGSGDLYIDNFTVTTSKVATTFTEGIGTCLGAEPDNVLVMEDMTEVTYPTTITNGTTYMYSFETKNDATGSDFTFGFGAGENAIWNATSGVQEATDWTTVAGVFTATSDASTIKFTRAGEGKVYIDDVSVQEISTDITPEIVVTDNTPNATNMPSDKENMISGGDFSTNPETIFTTVKNVAFEDGYAKLNKPAGTDENSRAFLGTPALNFVAGHSYTLSYYVYIAEATDLTCPNNL